MNYTLDMIILMIFESTKSQIPIKSDSIPSETNTTMVDPISSSLVAHETLDISSLTSLKNAVTLFAISNVPYRRYAGLEPGLLRTFSLKPFGNFSY